MPDKTAPYPDNSRTEWALKLLQLPAQYPDGLFHFAYSVWPTAKSRDRGDLPFLMNSHKAMVREAHQRIRRNAAGEMMHMSGIAVPELDVEEFLLTDRRAYRWVSPWQDDRGRTLAPFIFPTYWGTPEALDPQWQHETVIIPQAQQVEALIDQYLTGAAVRRLSGDHRGTTLDLQVGASAYDAYQNQANGQMNLTGVFYVFQSSTGTKYWPGMRWITASLNQGDTIDVAYASIYVRATSNDDVNGTLYFEEVAGPLTFSSTAFDISNRARTAAGASWIADAIGAGFQNTPSLVGTLQEVVTGLTPTALVLIGVPNADVLKTTNINAYDTDTTQAAKLHIEYTAVGGGPTPGSLHLMGVGI